MKELNLRWPSKHLEVRSGFKIKFHESTAWVEFYFKTTPNREMFGWSSQIQLLHGWCIYYNLAWIIKKCSVLASSWLVDNMLRPESNYFHLNLVKCSFSDSLISASSFNSFYFWRTYIKKRKSRNPKKKENKCNLFCLKLKVGASPAKRFCTWPS